MFTVVAEWINVIDVAIVVVATHTMIGIVIPSTFFTSVIFKNHNNSHLLFFNTNHYKVIVNNIISFIVYKDFVKNGVKKIRKWIENWNIALLQCCSNPHLTQCQ